LKIKFCGAARSVTGSKHLITLNSGKTILLDCGLYQGKENTRGEENESFGFDPLSINYLILSHAHIDHSGLIPRLVKQGFSGNIYCTDATKDLCKIMLVDSAHIQESDAAHYNKRRKRESRPPVQPLYNIVEAQNALKLFKPLAYNQWHVIDAEISLLFTFVGHITGSAAVNLQLKETNKTHNLTFTGDIGRKTHQIIKGAEPFPQAEIIITEATYGDRLHEPANESLAKLLNIVVDTCVKNKGKLIIPAFSVGRTQEIVYALDQLETAGKLPPIKVYVDSPLSTNATEIIKDHPECFNQQMTDYLKKDASPFGFNRLVYIQDVEESKLLNESKEPCIIISASGMAEAGRIVHHIANNIENNKNTILIVGYSEPSSLGGRLVEGNKEVKIFGTIYKVKANVQVMDSYSAHGDYQEMIAYLKCQNPQQVKNIFLVHGKFEVMENYSEKLKEEGFLKITIPEKGEEIEIN
jgi:metallo-beta-lactamase family protein